MILCTGKTFNSTINSKGMHIHNVFNQIRLLLVLNLWVAVAYGQDAGSSLQTAIEKKQFTFLAQSVTPMKGGIRQLDPGYSLSIKGDTLICNLPYFGQVYQPSFSAIDGGLNFTSTQFEYQTKTRKKGGGDIKIKTKDLPNQRQLMLTLFQNGTSSMNVTCSDRESISFRGTVDIRQE